MTHARLYLASDFNNVPELADLLQQGADVEHFVVDNLGVEVARSLRDRATLRPVTRVTRDFLVQFRSITIEAQNALLKLFEDPPESAVFHVVVKREDLLIPTVRSRLMLMQTSEESPAPNETFAAFKDASLADRLNEVAVRMKNKDTAWVEEIMMGAEKLAHQKTATDQELLQTVVFLRQYVGVRGASNKMLLEELALKLPRS